MPVDEVELHVIFSGRVQGVFFRATACEHARQLHLCGMVKNLSNGNVEMVVQGKKALIEELLAFLKSDRGPGRIDALDKKYRPKVIDYKEFRIEY